MDELPQEIVQKRAAISAAYLIGAVYGKTPAHLARGEATWPGPEDTEQLRERRTRVGRRGCEVGHGPQGRTGTASVAGAKVPRPGDVRLPILRAGPPMLDIWPTSVARSRYSPCSSTARRRRSGDWARPTGRSHVVLKAHVPGLVHKTEAGAVQLDLRCERAVRRAYRGVAKRFGDRLAGVMVQRMEDDGIEVLCGITQEPIFGPLVLFGLGGVATDVLGDTGARLSPLTDLDAAELIRSVRSAPLLLGHRGLPAADVAGIEGILLRLSRLAEAHSDVAELDLNPIIARPDEVVAVDARVFITPQRPGMPDLLLRHRRGRHRSDRRARRAVAALGLLLPTRVLSSAGRQCAVSGAPGGRPLGEWL